MHSLVFQYWHGLGFDIQWPSWGFAIRSAVRARVARGTRSAHGHPFEINSGTKLINSGCLEFN